MAVQASKIIELEDWRKRKASSTISSTDVISLESLADFRAKLELMKQNRRLLYSIESVNKKVYETTATATVKASELIEQLTATMVKASELIEQLTTDRLSGPVQFFLKLTELWHLDIEDACKLLGYDLSDINYVKQVLSGESPLRGRDPKDRIANLVVIRKRLEGLFRDIDAENEWLREKQADIGNKSPMELLLSGSMENLLLIKQFVEFVCGL